MDLPAIADQLRRSLKGVKFASPVSHVYDPLEYAWAPHEAYLARYGRGRREVVLVGMNPGPWGMAQTGVPFGEVRIVRDWLGIHERVEKPKREHPRVPILGFDCPRREVSGRRLWGWAKGTFTTPKRFFARFFVGNYCPLMFLEESGRNRTPDKLPAAEREALLRVCDLALLRLVECVEPKFVVAIGGFAESRARAALTGLDLTIGGILHPSAANPAANRDWEGRAVAQLTALGVHLP